MVPWVIDFDTGIGHKWAVLCINNKVINYIYNTTNLCPIPVDSELTESIHL